MGLDPDAASVLRVLHRDYRKMTLEELARSHALGLLAEHRVQAALDKLEEGGFVERHAHSERSGDRQRTLTRSFATRGGDVGRSIEATEREPVEKLCVC